MKAQILQTSDPEKDLAELWHLAVNLRVHTVKFDNELSANNRKNKAHWQNKIDEWIDQHTKKEDHEQTSN